MELLQPSRGVVTVCVVCLELRCSILQEALNTGTGGDEALELQMQGLGCFLSRSRRVKLSQHSSHSLATSKFFTGLYTGGFKHRAIQHSADPN